MLFSASAVHNNIKWPQCNQQWTLSRFIHAPVSDGCHTHYNITSNASPEHGLAVWWLQCTQVLHHLPSRESLDWSAEFWSSLRRCDSSSPIIIFLWKRRSEICKRQRHVGVMFIETQCRADCSVAHILRKNPSEYSAPLRGTVFTRHHCLIWQHSAMRHSGHLWPIPTPVNHYYPALISTWTICCKFLPRSPRMCWA